MANAAAEAPAISEWQAPPGWSAIDFISDLHLSPQTPRTTALFADFLERTRADAVFILGDLFEVWVGDDARHGGFEAEALALLSRAASRRTIGFMHGNRDFLVGAHMLGDAGVLFLPDPTLASAFGQRLLLTHGDALCLDDVSYQRFRREVRGDAWQRAFLARPLAERRDVARDIRAESEGRRRAKPTEAAYDVDPAEAARWLQRAGTDVLVHGHTHRPASEPWNDAAGGGTFVRHVLSDWDADQAGETPRADLLRWTAAGLQRLRPDDAVRG